jgi:CubicO group peptidase (beta-lactamase class C family)
VNARSGASLLAFLAACAPSSPAADSPLDRIVPAVLAEDRVPGAVVVAGGPAGVDFRRAYGEAQLSTVYDLASVTKVVATTTAALLLVEEGRIGLADPVSRWLPDFAGRDITIEELLAHRSGLPAYLSPKGDTGPEILLPKLAKLKDRKVFRYSCLNMIALARVVEEVSGKSLADVCRERIFGPLGMKDTGFVPAPSACARTAPDVPPGTVHDPLARAYGTASHRPGNAGLFSTGEDLAVFCRALLAGRLLKPETLRRMFTPDADTRGLGWDVFDDAPYAPGVGHTGFTGTLIWMDPATGRYVVVLSNRTLNGENVDVRRLRRECLAALAR